MRHSLPGPTEGPLFSEAVRSPFEQQQWLDVADGLLEHDLEPLQTLVFAQLDSIIRASSLVEMVNGFIRPYLHSCKGHVTQEMLNLMMFYHNHHRYKSGKRQGKAPIELLTGQAFETDWVDLLLQQVGEGHHAALGTSQPFSMPLALVPNPHERARPIETSPDVAIAKPIVDGDSVSPPPMGKAA